MQTLELRRAGASARDSGRQLDGVKAAGFRMSALDAAPTLARRSATAEHGGARPGAVASACKGTLRCTCLSGGALPPLAKGPAGPVS